MKNKEKKTEISKTNVIDWWNTSIYPTSAKNGNKWKRIDIPAQR